MSSQRILLLSQNRVGVSKKKETLARITNESYHPMNTITPKEKRKRGVKEGVLFCDNVSR